MDQIIKRPNLTLGQVLDDVGICSFFAWPTALKTGEFRQ